MVNYPGSLSRQMLVDHCQQQVVKIQQDINTCEENYDISLKQSDLQKCREWDRVRYLRMGEQLAFRNVCEWAKDQVEKESVFLGIGATTVSDPSD